MQRILLLFILILCCGITTDLTAQRKSKKKAVPVSTQIDESLYNSLQYRSIGPFRGGRASAVTGVAGKPNLFYMAATGGGVWRTKNGGQHWENISDGYFGGSVGAIAVSEYDPNVIYAGGGETTLRGNVSSGYGIWKSEDTGKTWEQKGVKESRHTGRIRIHPRDPNLVYVASIGNIYKDHAQRGVFRSKDGGDTWEKVLFVNNSVGAVDLTFDPNNPRVLYASTWKVRRTPYDFSSGGEGSGLWKSTDGGDNWENISTREGLPKGTLGIIGVSVSPVNSERVFALIENKDGGLFRSDNGGETWTKINDARKLRQRAWYYTKVYADTQDEDIVYIMNVSYHKSTDGGKSFKTYNAPHGDHHDLWIAPEDNQRMVIADDGGAQVSYDAGETWSTYENQPTAQFYRVTTDNSFPYRIYVAQQDNSTLRIRHRSSGSSIDEDDWESTAGGESGHIAIDPTNNDIVYGGSYDGFLIRKDHANDLTRGINVWPDNPMGHGVEDMKYRFQWNFPIFFSAHDPKKLYTASQHLHVTTNEGQSWQVISPDLTRNDTSKMVSSGGPITKDNTSVEYYGTIFAATESPRKAGLLWVGSDDGLVHVSQDGGKNWSNVTPPSAPKWTMINSIEADPHSDGGAYVAATSYKSGDFKPYLFKTKDYGKTWTKITNGIDNEHFTRALRADPVKAGYLYAGTETGMYVSFNDGANWQPFQLNLPIVPITDLAVKDNNLIVATQGRSIWMIDDLTVLHQMDKNIANKAFHLFQPVASYRMAGRQNKKVKNAGMNHPGGVNVHFYLNEQPTEKDTIELLFMETDGTEIAHFSTAKDAKKEKDYHIKMKDLKAGGNTFNWNMRYPKAKDFEGMIFWSGSLNGPQAMPGDYQVKLMVNGAEQMQPFTITPDPRPQVSAADYQKQFDFLSEIRDKVTEAHEAVMDIREIRKQLNGYTSRLDKDDAANQPLIDLAKAINEDMKVVEEALYQTQNRARQDPLNFPIRLTNKLAHLTSLSFGDYPPTDQAVAVKDDLTQRIDAELATFYQVKKEELPKFNALVKKAAIDAVVVPERE
ncbi:MAG: WD40/YVTN/BNR-like repeat-containing protein [Saprospiraceae bacterium]